VLGPVGGIFISANAHPPPYDKELTNGLLQTSFVNSGCFELTDLDAPRGIIIAGNLVPSKNAMTAPSFEQPTGGAIAVQGDLHTDGDLYVDGTLVDPNFDGFYPRADAIYYQGPDAGTGSVVGWGHLMVFSGENQAVSSTPLTAGAYRYTLRIHDDKGNETLDVIHFVVKK
jgi:hypothetical protein